MPPPPPSRKRDRHVASTSDPLEQAAAAAATGGPPSSLPAPAASSEAAPPPVVPAAMSELERIRYLLAQQTARKMEQLANANTQQQAAATSAGAMAAAPGSSSRFRGRAPANPLVDPSLVARRAPAPRMTLFGLQTPTTAASAAAGTHHGSLHLPGSSLQDATTALTNPNKFARDMFDRDVSRKKDDDDDDDQCDLHSDMSAAMRAALFEAVPDVEPWDMPLLRGPSYAMGVSQALINGTRADQPALLMHPAPIPGMALGPLELVEGDKLQQQQGGAPAIVLAQTPKEQRAARHVRRLQQAAEKEEERKREAAAAAASDRPPITDKLGIKHLMSGVAFQRLGAGYMTPTEAEMAVRKQVLERAVQHAQENHMRHILAAPRQVAHKLATLEQQSQLFPRVCLVRVAPLVDEHLAQRVKIVAKELFLKGLILYVSRGYLVGVLVGGLMPIRKFVHFIRSRLRTGDAADGGGADRVEEQSSAAPRSISDCPWQAAISPFAARHAFFPDMNESLDRGGAESGEQVGGDKPKKESGYVRFVACSNAERAKEALREYGLLHMWEALAPRLTSSAAASE